MKRREFITLLGGAAMAWPLCGARTAAGDAGDRVPQQPSPNEAASVVAAFHRGLGKAAIAKVRTSESSIAGQKVSTTAFRGSPPTSSAVGSP